MFIALLRNFRDCFCLSLVAARKVKSDEKLRQNSRTKSLSFHHSLKSNVFNLSFLWIDFISATAIKPRKGRKKVSDSEWNQSFNVKKSINLWQLFYLYRCDLLQCLSSCYNFVSIYSAIELEKTSNQSIWGVFLLVVTNSW